MNVYIIAAKNEGVSPGFKNTLDRKSISNSDTSGLREKNRFMRRMSFNRDLPARDAPIEDPISHEPRKEPDISS
jgi:hypothetical protein